MLFGLIGGKRSRAEHSRSGSQAERRSLVLAHGYNGLAYLSLYPGWEYFHATGKDGFVAYERHNGVALAVGDPVCAPGDVTAILDEFREWAASEHLTPAFVGSTPRLAESASVAGWKTLKIGEEPFFQLADYAPRGNSTKKVRSAANQARKSGVTVSVVPAGTRPSATVELEILAVQETWQETRKIKALAFTLRLAPLAGIEDKVVLLARHNGRLEGFVACIPAPARDAFYIEDMIRRPDAPNGVSELLFLGAIEACKERGAKLANLGLAPLRNTKRQPAGHRITGSALEFTFEHLNLFYKFKPLEHFKAKFGPDRWEDSFLVYRPGRLARVSIALLHAFTPGKLGPLSAAASRLRPQPDASGERRWSPGHLAGMGVSAGVAVAYSAIAVHNPELFTPFEFASHLLTAPVIEAGEAARGHLVLDSLLLFGAGGWYLSRVRSRSDQ
ncbi:MAG: DUF2156 domain-containing protein [Dehalococcoidia bacterium]|nr:DUF2156 domain-containing protein [Dehalococcoidia bacterium]